MISPTIQDHVPPSPAILAILSPVKFTDEIILQIIMTNDIRCSIYPADPSLIYQIIIGQIMSIWRNHEYGMVMDRIADGRYDPGFDDPVHHLVLLCARQ